MGSVIIRAYAELSEKLEPTRRAGEFVLEVPTPVDIIDLIQHLGIPPHQVDLVLVNGRPAHGGHPVLAGDRISLYPVFEAFDISGVTRFREEPLRGPRFIADVHLGKLAAFLRMLGFDTLHRNDYTDEELVRTSVADHRVLLSRDVRLLRDPTLTHAHRVHAEDPEEQLQEIVHRLHLAHLAHPFSRCMVCNTPLQVVPREEVLGRLPPLVGTQHTEFLHCPGCGRIYWQGSHHRRMADLIERVIGTKNT